MHYPRHISVPYLTGKSVLTGITGPLISNGMSEIFVNLRRLLILEVLARMELGISTAQGADQAADTPSGSQEVIARHLIGSANLRTAFEKIILRASGKPVERLFHNLRVSR